MSIVVLKKKSKRFLDKISGKGTTNTVNGIQYSSGFSLNGGYRNQGWVGQGVRGRTIIKTPFRGSVPVGHGGHDGKYPQNIISGAQCCTNDPGIIKRSNMNTHGYVEATVVHPTSVFCY